MINLPPPSCLTKPLTYWIVSCSLLLTACAGTGSTTSEPAEPAPEATPVASEPTPPAQTSQPAAPFDAGRQTAAADPADKPMLFRGTGSFVNPSPGQPLPPAEAEVYTLNYEGADIREVVWNVLEVLLKENYTVHPSVQGAVTLHSSRPIPRSALLPTLETLLRQYGFALVREGGLIKVMPAAQAIRGSVSPQLGAMNVPLRPGFGLRIVPLKFVPAKEMWKLIEPFTNEPNLMRIDETRNFLILAGTEQELRHLLTAIDLLDADYMAGMSVGLFHLRSADAKSVAQELSQVFGDVQQGPLAGVVRFVAIERLNGLLAITSQPSYLVQVEDWVEQLDRAGGGSGGRLYVYPVQHGKAESLAKLLNDIFERASAKGISGVGAAAAPPPAGQKPPSVTSLSRQGAVLSQDVRVIADKENNALVIFASAEDYDIIEAALRKLDVAQRQVLVEVMFAEVTLTDELQYGIEWYLNARAGRTITGRLGGAPTTVPWTAPNTAPTPFAPLSPQDVNVPARGGLTLIKSIAGGASVSAILNLLQTDSRVKVVATPSTMVADNHPATIKVGTRVPVKTQTQSATGTVSGVIESIQYIETGVLLDVTPRIASGSQVGLEINVEVSQARVNESSSIDSPEISNRSAKSTVTIGSGESVVLAGLMRQDKTTGSAGLPGLARIPVIGGLFGSQSTKDVRTELVVIITPRVVNDTRQARLFSEELTRQLPAIQEMISQLPRGPAMRLKLEDAPASAELAPTRGN